MINSLKNCWEILKCSREKGGINVSEFGECIASKEGLDHSYLAIAGTLCGGIVQGTTAQKKITCMGCDVYKLYNRTTGTQGRKVKKELPDEQTKYLSLMKEKMTSKSGH